MSECMHARGKILSYDAPPGYRWVEQCSECHAIRLVRNDNAIVPLKAQAGGI